MLYLTLGQTLPDGVAAAAPLWYGCHEVAKTHTEAVQRAADKKKFDEYMKSAKANKPATQTPALQAPSPPAP